MAGIVFISDGRNWSASSSVFYWAVDALAERARDDDLAERLREISEHNLGSLDLNHLSQDQRVELTALVRDLPAVARADLPESSEREAVIGRINELAGLFTLA